MTEDHGPPSGWAWATVDEVIESCKYGSSAKTNEDPSGVPVLRMGNLQDGILDLTDLKFLPANHSEFPALLLRTGDLLFNRTNSFELVGKSAVYGGLPSPCSYASYLVALRLGSACVPKYLCFYLNSHHGRVWVKSVVSQQVGQANVNSTKLRALRFPLAPLREQQRIVEKVEELFSELDTGVASLLRARANLKKYRAAVLKAAVTGELTAEWRAKHPNVEPATNLLERILAERRQKWEADQEAKFKASGKTPPKGWQGKYKAPFQPQPLENGFEPVPQGWCWAGLAQVATFQNGRPFPSTEYTQEGVKLLRPGNLYSDGVVGWTEKNTRCLPERWLNEFPDALVLGNELVMNLTAQSLKDEFLGRVCLTSSGERCLLNQRLARITPLNGFHPKFVLYLLKSSLFRQFVNQLNTGSLIQHMFTSQLDEFILPLPPLAEQEAIVAEVEQQFSVIAASEEYIAASQKRAARLRQSILKDAFSGRLLPQDPNDEPAAVMLDRIRQSRGAEPGTATRSRSRKKPNPSQPTE